MSKTKYLLILLSLLCVFVIAGCGGGGSGVSSANPTAFTPNYISSLDGLYHWQKLPINVYFVELSNWTSFYPVNLPTTAAQEWNQPAKQEFFQVVSSQDLADVVCTYVNNPPSDWAAGVAGKTMYSVDTTRNMMVPGTVSVTITVHVFGSLISESDLQAVTAHELGHVIGISGHSPNRDDLMYPSLQGVTMPTVRDLNTAYTAYPSYFSNRSVVPEKPWTLPEDPSAIVRHTIE